MNNAKKYLTTDLGVLVAAVVGNNPEAVNQNLQVLGLAQGGESESTMKSTIDALFNSGQFAKAKQALNVNYIPGVLNLEFDAAAQELLQTLPQKRTVPTGGSGGGGGGTANTINNWLPLVDHVLNYVCQFLGTCPPPVNNNGGPLPPVPFNWMPVYVIGGVFGAIILIGIMVFAFKK